MATEIQKNEHTEIVAETKSLIGSPRGVISGGSIGGRFEKPPGIAADRVVGVRRCGGDQERNGRQIGPYRRSHGRAGCIRSRLNR